MSPRCAVEHRDNDWASRSPMEGESEEVIMIEGVTEEMVGPVQRDYRRAFKLVMANFPIERNGALC
jgi:hypothetical protein